MPKLTKIDVKKVIRVDLVTSGETTKGWVHTHGMALYKKPELEIKGVPLFLGPAACSIINTVCDYFLNYDPVVLLGQTMAIGPMAIIKFVASTPIVGDEEHYKALRWEIVDAMEGICHAHTKTKVP